MPLFKYTAKNEFGEKVKGRVESNNEKNAAALLMKKNLLPINLNLVESSAFDAIFSFFNKVNSKDITTFTSQLSTMISAGLPILNALYILQESAKDQLAKLLNDIIKKVEGGDPFSDALAEHPDVFSRVYIQLVRAGETGGVLDEVLDNLSANLDKGKEIRGKIKGAMVYPAIVFLAMIIVVVVLMTSVVPQLTGMYDQFGAELPLPTKILISVSGFMQKFWWLLAILFVGGIAGFITWYKKTDTGRKTVDRLILKIPIFGTLIEKTILTDFCQTLSLLLGSGVSLVKSLEIVTKSMNNSVYREAMEQASKEVEKGIALSASVSRFEIFPALLYQMMAVGEETGRVDDVLNKLSEYFMTETEQSVENLTKAIEPIMIIFLAVVVGGIVAAIMLPIFNMSSLV